ncbi:MAG: hypothetical protein JSS35_01170, partial [Proteobacteria bacterium]|nr:hypothetical protein [Pseudomonadota bacterium]
MAYGGAGEPGRDTAEAGRDRRRADPLTRLIRRIPFGAFWAFASLTSLAWYGAIAWFADPPEVRPPAALARVLALPLAATGLTLLFVLIKWRQHLADRDRR